MRKPQVGEIWRDRTGEHSLVLDVYNDGYGWQAKVLTLETGSVWPAEPVECWATDRMGMSTNPYYCEKVG
jgi:hypothetical protein